MILGTEKKIITKINKINSNDDFLTTSPKSSKAKGGILKWEKL